jgi:L,D-peptidoglycan transpeptidase YkuD (ErfK/YbiS/YcfS/YnhG family)
VVKTLRILALAGHCVGSAAWADPGQLVVAIAPDLNSTQGTMRRFEKDAQGKWFPVSESIPVLFGKKGLARGRGLHDSTDLIEGPQKIESDGRTPTGKFKIGMVLSNEKHLPPGAKEWPFHQKTEKDAWVGNPNLPLYNTLYTLKPGEEAPAWFGKEKFKLGDPTFHWLILIEHNYPNATANAGSAIFFHRRRGETTPTIGCTSMHPEQLQALIKWLDPGKGGAEYVVLARSDYDRLWKKWQLPPPGDVLGTKN